MKQPTRAQEISFFLKSRYFIGKRLIRNLQQHSPVSRMQEMIGPYKVSESISLLKISKELEHQKLQDGKIHNLKTACKLFHGIRIARNEEFSFWKILGRPTLAKGYTIGREIRYGCVIPTVAGGLCQLSGALYEAATLGGFEITERHAHTATAEGMDIPESRDCTIFWNYVDLKFKPHLDISISALVTENELVISFYSDEVCLKIPDLKISAQGQPKKQIESCETCHEFDCHEKQKLNTQSTVIISSNLSASEKNFFNLQVEKYEYIFIPQRIMDVFEIWFSRDDDHSSRNLVKIQKFLSFSFWIRLLKSRYFTKPAKTVAEASLSIWDAHAKTVYEQIKDFKSDQNLILDQRLLPFLWSTGFLVDKKYSVLFRHLPMLEIQRRLSELAKIYPEDLELTDFRAPAKLADSEWQALKSAQKLFTNHDDLIELFDRTVDMESKERSVKSQALMSTPPRKITEFSWENFLPNRKLLFFPGPTMTREGKQLVKLFLEKSEFELCLLESEKKNLDFWQKFPVKYVPRDQIPWSQIAVFIHPTVFEGANALHQEAIRQKIPIIATTGIGLHRKFDVHLIDAGFSIGSVVTNPVSEWKASSKN